MRIWVYYIKLISVGEQSQVSIFWEKTVVVDPFHIHC